MASTPFFTSGRILLSLLASSNSISPYIADFNESHVFNPLWTLSTLADTYWFLLEAIYEFDRDGF